MIMVCIVMACVVTTVSFDQHAGDAVKPAQPQYVGRQVCGECHRENYDSHLAHGHASTFFTVAESGVARLFDGKTVSGGEGFGDYAYQQDENGNLTVSLADAGTPNPHPLQFVLGSGHNAQTILSLKLDADGQTEGIEHRISCYAGGRLDVTVGHEDETPAAGDEQFGKPVQGEVLDRCVYCHTTTSTIANAQIANLVPHVNCEKCHGPGSEHVRLARENQTPPPYSVGLETWDRESELQLCGDCHRLPRSISLRELREYPDTLVRFQPVGMLRSKCYLESEQKLQCTTCHNPHQSIHGSGQKANQIKNCINCHDQTDASHVVCPVSATDNCIECHMPPVDQKQGIKFHDHWIRVRE